MPDESQGTLMQLFLLSGFLVSLHLGLRAQAVAVDSSLPFVWYNDRAGENTSARELVDIYSASLTYSDVFQNGSFSLGFLNSTPGVFTLGVVMPDVSKVVWEANRDDPVGVNASVTLTSQGELVLRDADGRIVWSTGTANLNASVVEVQETGNLVVFSNNETVLWQSFDHPTDTLRVNQEMKPGMKLQSRKTRTDPSPGLYSLVMEPGGLVLYSNFTGRQEPYWIQGYNGKNDLASARSRVCEASLVAGVLDASLRFNMSLTSSSSSCMNETQSWQLIRTSDGGNTTPSQSFIRLVYDGNLRSYSTQSSNGSSLELFDHAGSCMLPQKCSPFGVCSNGECQECVNSNGATVPWTSNCSFPGLTFCSNDIPSLGFISVAGVEYFPNQFLSSSSVTLDECRRSCLFNCSCSAFFYWDNSSSCFTTDDRLTTLRRVSNVTHVAYIKVSQGSGSKLSSGATAGIILGCFFLVLVVLAVSAILCIKRKKSQRAVDRGVDSFTTTNDNNEVNVPESFSYAKLEIITEKFSKVLGTGDLGTVYEGLLPDGRTVAVKKLDNISKGKREFHEEVTDLGSLHHWNLVKLLGYCSERHHRLLVYEYMANGSLDKWIYRDNEVENFLEWDLRMGVLLGVARGLAYLHSEFVECIIHLDVKPENILLDSSFVAKVTDYGVSRLMARDQRYVLMTMRSNQGYLAPEWFGEGGVTEKSDVYSFGIVLLEVISGYRCLFDKERSYLPQVAAEAVRDGRVKELVDPRLKDVEVVKVESAVKIAFQCIQEEASLRPSMSRVIQMLEGSSAF